MWQDRAYSSPSMGWYVSRARATWWIVGITVVAHVVRVIISGQDPELGFKLVDKCQASVPGWHDFELWRSFTYLLIHAGTSHILWNMLFLGVAGTLLEPHIGSRAFLRIYLLSGVIGALSP